MLAAYSFCAQEIFGRLLADHAYALPVSCRVYATSLAAQVKFCNERKRLRVICGGLKHLDTVGVRGSNPRAPTISIFGQLKTLACLSRLL